MKGALFLWHCLSLCVMSFAMFYGSSLLASPSYSGGPFNLGGLYRAFLGVIILFLTQLAASFFYPVASPSPARRLIHCACWLCLLEGMIYAYIKFPYNVELIRYPDKLDMWFPASEILLYFILCMASFSLYMGMADPQKKQSRQLAFSLAANFIAFNILTRLTKIFVYLI